MYNIIKDLTILRSTIEDKKIRASINKIIKLYNEQITKSMANRPKTRGELINSFKRSLKRCEISIEEIK